MNLKHVLFAVTSVVVIASCKDAGTGGQATQGQERKLLDPANLDTTVHPGDNFFQYANGTWLKKNPIPETESRWGSFNELQENNYKALHGLLDSAAGILDWRVRAAAPLQRWNIPIQGLSRHQPVL